MKIVSRFKDYYDALRAHDRDDDPLYVRETTEHVFHGANACPIDVRRACDALWTQTTVPPQYPPRLDDSDDDEGDGERQVDFVRGVIGFCGRLYAFVRLNGVMHYDFAAFGVERPARRRTRSRSSARAYWRANERRAWADFERNRTRAIEDAVFRHFDAPVLLMTDQHVVVNPCLRPWDFATQVDPYTAWQELSMFIGNNLVKNTMTARPISDALKAEAHGFDSKQSFRKGKTPRPKVDRGEW